MALLIQAEHKLGLFSLQGECESPPQGERLALILKRKSIAKVSFFLNDTTRLQPFTSCEGKVSLSKNYLKMEKKNDLEVIFHREI